MMIRVLQDLSQVSPEGFAAIWKILTVFGSLVVASFCFHCCVLGVRRNRANRLKRETHDFMSRYRKSLCPGDFQPFDVELGGKPSSTNAENECFLGSEEDERNSKRVIALPLPGCPKTKTRKEQTRSVSNQCIICLASYEVSECVSWSSNPNCTHAFHTDCISDWLEKQDECPCCRQAFVLIPGVGKRDRTKTEDTVESASTPQQ